MKGWFDLELRICSVLTVGLIDEKDKRGGLLWHRTVDVNRETFFFRRIGNKLASRLS